MGFVLGGIFVWGEFCFGMGGIILVWMQFGLICSLRLKHGGGDVPHIQFFSFNFHIQLFPPQTNSAPGPGAYSVHEVTAMANNPHALGAKLSTTTERFRRGSTGGDQPGPGQYDLEWESKGANALSKSFSVLTSQVGDVQGCFRVLCFESFVVQGFVGGRRVIFICVSC